MIGVVDSYSWLIMMRRARCYGFPDAGLRVLDAMGGGDLSKFQSNAGSQAMESDIRYETYRTLVFLLRDRHVGGCGW